MKMESSGFSKWNPQRAKELERARLVRVTDPETGESIEVIATPTLTSTPLGLAATFHRPVAKCERSDGTTFEVHIINVLYDGSEGNNGTPFVICTRYRSP